MSKFRRLAYGRDAVSDKMQIPDNQETRTTWTRASALLGEKFLGSIRGSSHAHLCGKCSKIPWDHFLDQSEPGNDEFPVYDLPPNKLRESNCRLCQFIGQALIEIFDMSKPSAPPYQLKRQPGTSSDISDIAILRFKELGGYWTQPLRGANTFLVLNHQQLRAESNHGSVMVLGGLPLQLIKQSIAFCQSDHISVCQPNSGEKLTNLRVFDCENRKIIIAPPGCDYVALSYVWGSRTGGTEFGRAFDPNFMPKTVDDSVRVTQALGYRFLWVDRYVSRQDNDARL